MTNDDNNNDVTSDPHAFSRRRLFSGGAAMLGAAAALPALLRAGDAHADAIGPQGDSERQRDAFTVRRDAASDQKSVPVAAHPDNGDEGRYPDHSAMFHKSLPHDNLGLVDPVAYGKLLQALQSGSDADFAQVPTGSFLPLISPQAAYAYSLIGADSHALGMPAAPAMATAETAGEMVEVYWQALARDVPFANYATDPTIARAVADLNRLSDFRGPRQLGLVTPQTVFRGNTPGDVQGFYLSQFLLMDVPYGQTTIVQRYQTRFPDFDHMTTWDEWLSVQRGETPTPDFLLLPMVGDPLGYDPVPRYLRNNRDLAEYVHTDWAFQAYLNAALICLSFGKDALDRGNPYFTRGNRSAFVTFGGPHIQALLGVVADAAFKAAWFQKWLVHRRLRPEVYAARLHHTVTGVRAYPIHDDALNSDALAAVDEEFGSFLMPMAYREGSPAHPAYPAGHGTVAGACVTVLKAFFHEAYVIEAPVRPDVDGLILQPLTPELGGTPFGPTLGDELNKLASNIAIGRDAAGVHYRSDGIEGMLLGEQVAISILRDLEATYNEPFAGYSFTKFDGTTVVL